MPSIFSNPPFTGDPQSADILWVGDDSDQLDKKGTVAQFVRFIRGIGANSTKLIDGAGTATNTFDLSLGSKTNATGGHSVASGESTVSSGTHSWAAGLSSLASGAYAWATGFRAVAARYGEWARSSFRFTTDGDAQIGQFHVANQTANATPTPLFMDGTGFSQGIIIADNSAIVVQALVTARNIGASEVAGYRLAAIVKRDVGVGTTVLVGAQEKVVLGEDIAAWDASLVADAVFGGINVLVTGEAGKTLNWSAKIDTSEIFI